MMFFNKRQVGLMIISIFLMFLCLGAVCASDISTENNTNCDISGIDIFFNVIKF